MGWDEPSIGLMTAGTAVERERADYDPLLVCGRVLVTVREALTVAPGIAFGRVAVLPGWHPKRVGTSGIVGLHGARVAVVWRQ